METSLCKLAFKYGTDKCPKIGHSYTPVYYQLFKKKKDQVKKLLEIGIGYKSYGRGRQYKDYQVGASLMMWRDFFPNAQIYGIDIVPSTLIKGERIHTYLCDQYNPNQLRELIKSIGTDIDVVIDDGSHDHNHQVWTCQFLMSLLKKDVTYVIEDVFYQKTVMRRLGNLNTNLITFPTKIHDDALIVVKNK